MKELSTIFNGVEMAVEVRDNDEMFFDISGIANKYGKRFSNFEKLDNTQNYLKSVRKVTLLNKTELIRKVGNSTIVHHLIMIEFARWINPAFSVLANKIVFDVLTEGCKVNEKKVNKLESKLIKKEERIAELQKKVYAKPRGKGFETVTRIISDYKVDLSATDFNKLLISEGYLSEEQYIAIRYIPNNIQSMESNNSIVVHVDSVLELLKKHNVKKVEDRQQQFTF